MVGCPREHRILAQLYRNKISRPDVFLRQLDIVPLPDPLNCTRPIRFDYLHPMETGQGFCSDSRAATLSKRNERFKKSTVPTCRIEHASPV